MLRKTVSINAKRQPLVQVLNDISRQGNFHFSYTSQVVRNDSLVTLSLQHKTVKQALDILFAGSCQYREMDNYVLLLPTVQGRDGSYIISGYVKSAVTGERIINASVYERNQFISTLTNEEGFFRIRLKDRYAAPAITISKELFADTSLRISPGFDQEISIAIAPAPPIMLMPVVVNPVEKTWMAKFLLSPKQVVQSFNLGEFFTKLPFQYSLLPGLGTHGGLGSQVINKFSFNLIGGYSAGLNGVEIGGLFNIDKRDVRFLQFAGLFNAVGGRVNGVQLAGLHNRVLDSMRGVQLAGLSNITRGPVKGVQATGLYNRAGSIRGLQASGIANISVEEVRGLQIGSIFNYTKHLKGVQIGLINISDTSSGYAIGLLNIVRKGYRKLDISSNELTNVNLTFRTGRKQLYSILTAGYNIGENEKAISFGYGIGREYTLSRRLALTSDITIQNLYLGSWENTPQVFRVEPLLHFQLGRKVRLFAGPSLTLYFSGGAKKVAGYKSVLPMDNGYPSFNIGDEHGGWIGWRVGISLF